MCWTITYEDRLNGQNSGTKIGEHLEEFVGKWNEIQGKGEWRQPGISKGCLVNAHGHKWEGEQLLSDAISNAKRQHLRKTMYQSGDRKTEIALCQSDDCNYA